MLEDAVSRPRSPQRGRSSFALPAETSAANPRLLTISEVAERLCVSQKFVRRLIWAHELRHHRLGRAVRIPEEALREYLQRTEVPAVG